MRKVYGWSVAGVVLFGGLAVGQGTQPSTNNQIKPGQGQPIQNQQNQNQQNQVRPGVAGGNQQVQQSQQGQQSQRNADQEVAALIAACNRNEVEIAKFAMSRLKSDEAKEVATLMIKDHTAGAEKFAKWAGTTNTSIRSEGREEGRGNDGDRREERRDSDRNDNREGARANPATTPNNPAARVAVQGTTIQPNTQPGNAGQPRVALRPVSGQLNWSQVHQEVAAEGLESCKKELSRYEGNDFDKAFLGHQLGAHMMAATQLKVLRNHVSSELASEIDDAHATTEKHIKHLREVMDEKKDQK
ncbi:hypothetical protein ETAA8_64790 [Anatilimnocola aggregata]|uniref:DUF4142 domain-containing protein n=1 Tax=Anatilimnocola aggregata TaxID=2528021 RepID=A0A517YM88_9BACT|nr:DUF4142 domain-containing protein [Anatilimnocola aggregata]QDU31326.1 hypothetical protein ETAA8_64790 [Anatilimnocola aggregata]